METIAATRSTPGRHASTGYDGRVYKFYWVGAALLMLAMASGLPLAGAAAVATATAIFIFGGLPHGAYDIALLRRAIALDRAHLSIVVVSYVAIAMAMALLWSLLPLVALVLFLVVAAVHFGEDWQMLEEPLLRVAAGAAVIAAATIGHRAEVTALFVAMSDGRAVVVARIVAAAAPATLLVTLVGIAVAWQEGSREWAGATALGLLILIVAPPVAGFALFFVFLHSPRHFAQTRAMLPEMTRMRWVVTGGGLSVLTVVGWWVLHAVMPARPSAGWTPQAFQLLASVAVPHLMLSRWIERRTARGSMATM